MPSPQCDRWSGLRHAPHGSSAGPAIFVAAAVDARRYLQSGFDAKGCVKAHTAIKEGPHHALQDAGYLTGPDHGVDLVRHRGHGRRWIRPVPLVAQATSSPYPKARTYLCATTATAAELAPESGCPAATVDAVEQTPARDLSPRSVGIGRAVVALRDIFMSAGRSQAMPGTGGKLPCRRGEHRLPRGQQVVKRGTSSPARAAAAHVTAEGWQEDCPSDRQPRP